jgi:hypothetical protein
MHSRPACPQTSTGHIVLLGDSVFDNKAYVRGGPDVVAQLREELPSGWAATLLAVDGETASGVARQLRSLPKDATHLAVSAGGNDALGFAYLLQQPAGSVAEALSILGSARDQFAASYAAMAAALNTTGLPTAVCTIYDTPPSGPDHQVIKTGAAVFNDCITRAAFTRGFSLIDLRLVCNEDGDYAETIEPSAQGGAKIARAIATLLFPAAGAPRSSVVSVPRPGH